jgi:hypothetical protein
VIEDGSGNKIISFGGGGGGAGSNASVGANGAVAPTSATEIGFVNPLGNLAAVSASNPLPVAIAAENVTLTVSAATNLVTSDSGVAITGANLPSGGAGVTGWLSAIWSKLTGTLTVSGSVAVTNLPATQPVSATALPLPAGAATAVNQPTLNADGGALAHVTNFPSTQSVSWSSQSVALSGTLPAFASTPTFNLGALNGAATDAHLTNVQSAPGAAQTTAITVQGNPSAIAIPVSLASLPALPAGSNAIGSVSVSALPGLAAGANLIGAVNLDIGGATISQSNPVPTTETYSNIATGQVTVASTATQIVAARAGRKEVTIVNNATTVVYLGGSSVTSTTGLMLAGATGEGITISGGAAIYGIVATGSESVSFLEVY